MASLKAKIVNIGTDSFRDSQSVQSQQTCQSMIPSAGQASLHKEDSEFVAIQSTHGGLLALPWSSHVRSRVSIHETFLGAVPVEACHR
jgi:hypothetical protein